MIVIEENTYKEGGNGENGCGKRKIFVKTFFRREEQGEGFLPMVTGTAFNVYGEIVHHGKHDGLVPRPGETIEIKTWDNYSSGLIKEGSLTILHR